MSSAEQTLSRFEMLWELPLSVLSFLFYRAIRLTLRQLVRLNFVIYKEQCFRWRFTSREMLDRFLVLPVLMTVGPRWNPHAITASVGPFKVKKEIRMHVTPAEESARAWTAVIYSYPDNRTLLVSGSLDSGSAEEWKTFALKPGKYALGLRYYRWTENVVLPAVKVDGVEVAQPRTVPANVNDFYKELPNRRSLFYRCLHQYVFVLLSLRGRLPRAFVEKEYLPVGNPETQFCYGAFRKGHSLHFSIEETLLTTHDTYLTLYTRDSFPALWYQIKDREHLSPQNKHDGFYVVRLQARITTPEFLASDRIKITVR